MAKAFYSERKRFDAELMKALRALVKGTRWRKSQNALFTQTDDYFQQVFVCVNYAEPRTTSKWSFKPMAADSILWEITDCAECARQPLSFRCWGINCCQALPFLESEIENAGDLPEVVAARIVSECLAKEDRFRELLVAGPFSALAARHADATGDFAFATTHVLALIQEGDLLGARRVARNYSDRQHEGPPPFNRGLNFFDQANAWLDRTRSGATG